MERPFDHLNRDCENKKNNKKSSKKRWLLSRQYLQPLDEHDDDINKNQISDPSVKNKLRCICRSAFYGMKEGLLTGIFIGGFYGIFKLLSRSSSAFYGSDGGRSNENEAVSEGGYRGGVPHERRNPARNRRADTRAYHSSGRRQSGSRSNSISYQEKLSSYKTIEETIYGYTKESKPQAFLTKSHIRNIDLNYSKLPVRTVKCLGPLHSKIDDKKKYSYGKTSERVEIVGYAFIKTTGAFESESSGLKTIEYGSPKQSRSALEREEEEEEEEEDPPIDKSKSSMGSTKTLLDRHVSDSAKSSEKSSIREKSTKSFKSKESVIFEKPEKSSQSIKYKNSALTSKYETPAQSLKSEESAINQRPEKSSQSIKNKDSALTSKYEKSAQLLKSEESAIFEKPEKSSQSIKYKNSALTSKYETPAQSLKSEESAINQRPEKSSQSIKYKDSALTSKYETSAQSSLRSEESAINQRPEKSFLLLKSKESVITEKPEESSQSIKSQDSVITERPEKSSQSIKSKESALTTKHEKSAQSSRESVLTAKYERSSFSAKSGNSSKISVLDKSFPPSRTSSDKEPKDSRSKGLVKAISSLKGASSKSRSRQSIINESEEQKQKPSRITIVSPKYHSIDSRGGSTDQSNSVLIKSLEPDQSEISTRPTNDFSQDSRLRSKDSSKTSKPHSKHSVRSSVIIESDPDSAGGSQRSSRTTIKSKPSEHFKRRNTGSISQDDENLYPHGRAPSYLVNADEISNGYGSPLSSQEQQSDHETIHSKFSEDLFSPEIMSSKADFDEVGLTGSNLSEFQIKSPFRLFSPSISVSLADQNKTPKNSVWSLNATRDTSSTHIKEAAIPHLKDESGVTLKTPKQSRSVIFTDSRRDTSETSRPDVSELTSMEHSDKLFLSSEQVSEKLAVSEETHSEKLRILSEQPSARSDIPSEQYVQKSQAESREPSKMSHHGVIAKSSSSLIQNVGPDSSMSSVSKAAPVAPRAQKISSDQEEPTGMGIFSSVSDNTIVFCACNCALVLGILCTIISSTRASLKI